MSFYKNRRALITGASVGLGKAFAQTLAAAGCHVVLVARSKDKLDALAAQLVAEHGVQAQVIVQDLTLPGAVARVCEQLHSGGEALDILINNAGFGSCGRFEQQSVSTQLQEVQLNIAAPLELAHTLLPGMRQRGFGGIINVASTAAFQPLPYLATYSATKSFLLSWSEALWAENKDRNVGVVALCPGPTATQFFANMGHDLPTSAGKLAVPEVVVRQALSALEQGRSHIVAGARNYLGANASRFVPRQTLATMAEKMMRPCADAAAPHTRHTD